MAVAAVQRVSPLDFRYVEPVKNLFPKEFIDAFGGAERFHRLEKCEKQPRRPQDLFESYAIRGCDGKLLSVDPSLPKGPVILRGETDHGTPFLAIFFPEASALIYSPYSREPFERYLDWQVSRHTFDGYILRRIEEKDLSLIASLATAIHNGEDPTPLSKKIIGLG